MNRNYPLYDSLPQIESLCDMAAIKLRERPDETAFISYDRKENATERTFLEFCSRVCAVSMWLEKREITGTHIALLGENSYEWLVLFMALTLTENAAVALDKDMPGEELAWAAEYTDTKYVFLSRDQEKKAALIKEAAGVKGILFFEEICPEGEEEPGREAVSAFFESRRIDPDRVCCMFFTSGTGGRRKAVMLSHRNIAEDINGICSLFELKGNTCTVLPFHHAFGLIAGVWTVFHYGHAVCISSGIRRFSSELRQSRPQAIILVPLFVETFYRQIMQAVRKSGREKSLQRAVRISDFLLKCGIDLREKLFGEILSSFGGNLEYIVCGGAPLDSIYVKKFRSLGIEILNGYGTTECSPVAATNRNHYHRDGSVGLALPGTRVKMAEDGEVLIRGPHVMLGYYKEEEENAVSLAGGWYHTGDLGRIDEDGFIFLTGRKKNLIILSNGENVSPEELEEKLARFENIREVIVYAKEGVICAEIYPGQEVVSSSPEETEALKNHIREEVDCFNRTMPDSRRIGEIVFRDRPFEKTTSSKIRR